MGESITHKGRRESDETMAECQARMKEEVRQKYGGMAGNPAWKIDGRNITLMWPCK